MSEDSEAPLRLGQLIKPKPKISELLGPQSEHSETLALKIKIDELNKTGKPISRGKESPDVVDTSKMSPEQLSAYLDTLGEARTEADLDNTIVNAFTFSKDK